MRSARVIIASLLVLLSGIRTTHADEPGSIDETSAEPPVSPSDEVVGPDGTGDAIEPAPREQGATAQQPQEPGSVAAEPSSVATMSTTDITSNPIAAADSVNQGRGMIAAAPPDGLAGGLPPDRTAAPSLTEPALTEITRPRPPVSRQTFVDAGTTTVMLATTIADSRNGSLQPLRGPDGVITGWKVRAVSAKQYFGICDDDAFVHVYRDRTVGMCTGFFVAPDLVLTAGHCLDAVRKLGNLRVVLDYAAPPGTDAPRILRPEQVLTVELEERGQGPGQDWALLRVIEPGADERVAPICRPSDDCRGEEGIFSVSHPLGMPRRFLTNARVLETGDGRIVTDLDTFVGSSGSPVFDRRTGRVLGMVVSGRPDFHRARVGCMRTAVVHRDATQRRGEIAMPIDRLPGSLALRILPWQSLRKRAALGSTGSPAGTAPKKKKKKKKKK